MSRPLTPPERRLLAATRSRLDALGVHAEDVDAALALAADELSAHPATEDDEPDRVDPRLVARAVAGISRPHLQGRDVAPARHGGASPTDLVRELGRRLGSRRSGRVGRRPER